MASKVRVRFAPSPTGPLHIGGVRTALYNYLFAKKHGGDFLLRIEDTDQTRHVPGAEEYIIESLNWLNIPFDEGPGKNEQFGPYRQSERKDWYKKYVDILLASGHAYYAFDSSEELDAHRKAHEEKGKTFIYNWHNRSFLKNSLSLSEKKVREKLQAGEEFVVRFKTPEAEMLSFKDIVRGEITVNTNELDDKVLFKSDGMPTYHLANIVDDHLMEISHVIRGEEWLPSLPLHLLLYRALDWEAPQFAHLPLIMKPQGIGKLSKRDGDKMGFPVFPLEWKSPSGEIFSGYREAGFLPEAVLNFLALLGWNPGTEQEIFSLSELTDAFELERVHKAGAKFDPEKIKWFQHYYFQQQSSGTLAENFKEFLIKNDLHAEIDLVSFVGLIKDRASFVSDFWEQGNFFFMAPESYDAKASQKAFKPESRSLLQNVQNLLADAEDFSAANLSTTIKSWAEAENIGIGNIMMPLRLALVGEMKGPDVFEIISLLGKKETVKRTEKAIAFLDQK